ncbi:MAG: cupin domain-containing protein [Candidatus Woesearchaeota archaeon]
MKNYFLPKILSTYLLNLFETFIYEKKEKKEGGYYTYKPLTINLNFNLNIKKKLNTYFNYSIYNNYFNNIKIISFFKIKINPNKIIKKHMHEHTFEIFLSNKNIVFFVNDLKTKITKNNALIIPKKTWHFTKPKNTEIIFYGIKFTTKNYNINDDKILY